MLTEKLSYQSKPGKTLLVEIEPDQLIELGHRMKAYAMDHAYPGETVMISFSAGVTLVWNPDLQFTRPVDRMGLPMIQAQAEIEEG